MVLTRGHIIRFYGNKRKIIPKLCLLPLLIWGTDFLQKALQECETEWSQNKKVVDISQKDIRHAVSLLTLLHSERPKLYTILAFLNAIGLIAVDKTIFQNHTQNVTQKSSDSV